MAHPVVHLARRSDHDERHTTWPVIGGLITSTALSLIVIPAAYTVLHDVGDWLGRLWRRKHPVAAAIDAAVD